MEVTLKVGSIGGFVGDAFCFNPCFNGSDSKRTLQGIFCIIPLSFNPCFNGSDSKSQIKFDFRMFCCTFQSLF